MGPFVLVLLVAWFLVYRFGADIRTVANRAVARGARAAARVAGRIAGSSPAKRGGIRAWAGRARDRLQVAADLLRSRPTPTTPRTASGQTKTAKTDPAANRWLGMVVVWLRVTWADAVAAAESAQQRRMGDTEDSHGPWWSWPTGDEPQAPIQATAERTDRAPSRPTLAMTEPNVVDAEIVEDEPVPSHRLDGGPETTPLLSATPVAALPVGTTGGHMSETTVDNTAAESGLGSYLAYSQKMAGNCGEAVNSAEATLGSLRDNDWSGVPVEAIQTASEHLAAARDQFNTAYGAFQAALSVREAYSANGHAGTKDSVMAD